MTSELQALAGADILTPAGILQDHALLFAEGRIEGVTPVSNTPGTARVSRLDGGLLVPGFVDLQVNGGGGAMLNNAPELETLRTMSRAHARIGATSILPTLITDTPEVTRRAIAATIAAVNEGVPGIVGLHLEGPHLSQARKGAHDAALIRPMAQADLDLLLDTAAQLPVLKVTVAPESVTDDQIHAMTQAGIVVSLGHTDASFETCQKAAQAGARCVTHLFNAQSQMGNREPGVVGAALALGELSAGLIADGIHVHPVSVRNAIRANNGPGSVFLVSDAMATAGSDIDSFLLNGRQILRDGNRLTLADGTLAGAHLELLDAVRNVVAFAQLPLQAAFDMATRLPADLIGRTDLGRLAAGASANVLHVSDHGLLQVWQEGHPLS
ncbi:N-acetylglucosamine-6-phosphate deacetylase [Ruegeria arenilitoris]|uniref:N-acetylglucosamine-6-phosphate deacetylase n=1 Tax=Ruegeria arenilitoris TaxID=1173585 RepID=UPI001479A529|nr:N-acetylglucosamine-6-phosphate deacetylase [Ruegeria arenilitoris]